MGIRESSGEVKECEGAPASNVCMEGKTSRAQGRMLTPRSRSSLDLCSYWTWWREVCVRACRLGSAERPGKVSSKCQFFTNHPIWKTKLLTSSLNSSWKSLHGRIWFLLGSARSWKDNTKWDPNHQRCLVGVRNNFLMQGFYTVYGVSPPKLHFCAWGEERDWE